MAASSTGARIDSLDIKITTTASSAIKSLQALARSIEQVTEAALELQDALNGQTEATEETTESEEETVTVTEQLVEVTNRLANASHKATGGLSKLVRAFGRIILYRAIRTIIKDIGAAIKEGIVNLEDYSREVGTAFAPAVDDLRRHVLLLKNAFATALRPVIEALIPVIIRLVDWLSKAADFVAQVFSILFGKVDENGRYTRAILTDLQQSNKEAKKLLRTLLGFDEINRLDGETGSGSSTGTGLMFEQADVSPEAVAWAEKLAHWIGIIKNALGQIDWDVVLKVLAALKVAQIIGKIVEWLKPIAALLGGSGGILAVVLAIIAAFALWGDKIKEFIDKKAIPKTDEWFEKIRRTTKSGGIFDNLLTALNNIVDAVLTLFGSAAKAVYNFVHGDFEGAIREIRDGIVNAKDYLARALGIVLATLAKIILDWLNEKVLGPLEEKINLGIEWINRTTRQDLDPVKLTVDTSGLDKTIATLKKTKLPDIKENVKIRGEYSQSPFKFNLDTTEANRKLGSISTLIGTIGRGLANIVNLIPIGSHGAGTGFASGGYPAVGSVFVAGEAGPEWVGDIGGRTGVMNTDQMAAAMYNAMTAALATMPQGGGDIYLDGEVIYRNVVNRNNNSVRSTGRSALLT